MNITTYISIYICVSASPTTSTTTTACSLKTTTPTLTPTTTAMQMLPLTAATSFEHRGPQCLLTLGRWTSPPLDQFPVRVCSCPLCIVNRLCIYLYAYTQTCRNQRWVVS